MIGESPALFTVLVTMVSPSCGAVCGVQREEAMTSTISGAPVTPGKLVGQRVKHTEDPRLIRGQATYVDDMTLPGMLQLLYSRTAIFE